jgi:hypothetical protein
VVKDLIKAFILFNMYCVAAPLIGAYIKNNRGYQRIAFSIMAFMTMGGLFHATQWGLTLGSVEWYRGHTKGYHFYFVEFWAIVLISATLMERRSKATLNPIGLWLWYFYCFLSFLSIVNAPNANYVIMCAFRYVKVAIIFIAAYNYLRDEEDLMHFIKTMAFCLMWQAFVCLKLRYLEGRYQIHGTFEHQNPLAMYILLIFPAILAMALSDNEKLKNSCVFGYMCGGLCILLTVSRAAFALTGAGTVGMIFMSLLQKATSRRVVVSICIAVIGSLGVLKAMDTLMGRFMNSAPPEGVLDLREIMIVCCQEMYKDYPLGYGWNCYAHGVTGGLARYADIMDDWTRTLDQNPIAEFKYPIVESHYYLLLGETGIQSWIGYFLFIGVFSVWNLMAWIYWRRCDIGMICLGFLAGASMCYLQSFVERILTQPRNMMEWMIILGVTAKIEFWRRAQRKLEKKYKVDWKKEPRKLLLTKEDCMALPDKICRRKPKPEGEGDGATDSESREEVLVK